MVRSASPRAGSILPGRSASAGGCSWPGQARRPGQECDQLRESYLRLGNVGFPEENVGHVAKPDGVQHRKGGHSGHSGQRQYRVDREASREDQWMDRAGEAKNKKGARSQGPLPQWKHPSGKLRSGSPDSWIPDKPGAGSDTIIQFNLDLCDEFDPGELVLGHELIHARRNARGLQLVGTDGLGQSLEERAVTGGWDPPGPMTGNALRLDMNKRPGARRLNLKKIFRSDGYRRLTDCFG